MSHLSEQDLTQAPDLKTSLQIDTLVALLLSHVEQFERDFLVSKWQDPERIKLFLDSTKELRKYMLPDERTKAVIEAAQEWYNKAILPWE